MKHYVALLKNGQIHVFLRPQLPNCRLAGDSQSQTIVDAFWPHIMTKSRGSLRNFYFGGLHAKLLYGYVTRLLFKQIIISVRYRELSNTWVTDLNNLSK